jgi:predicted CopG family antitoxin
MAVKTITIDLAAYGLLLRRKREGQSFSDVIKDHFGVTPSAGTFKAIVRAQRETGGGLSEDVLDAIDEVIRDRANDPVSYPTLES